MKSVRITNNMTHRFVASHRSTVLEWAKSKIIKGFILYFIFYIPL